MKRRRMHNRIVNIEMYELDEIKKDYDRAHGELRAQLKVAWYNKVKEIAARIRRKCGKEHGTVTNMSHFSG
jgi:lysozyme family protein